MPTFEVNRGDTVWGLTRQALTEQLGRRPTNAEVLQVVRQVQVPSGNVDLIRPGEQITIPVGPGYESGPSDPPPGFDPPFSPEPGSPRAPFAPSSPDYPFGPGYDGPRGDGVVPAFPRRGGVGPDIQNDPESFLPPPDPMDIQNDPRSFGPSGRPRWGPDIDRDYNTGVGGRPRWGPEIDREYNTGVGAPPRWSADIDRDYNTGVGGRPRWGPEIDRDYGTGTNLGGRRVLPPVRVLPHPAHQVPTVRTMPTTPGPVNVRPLPYNPAAQAFIDGQSTFF